MKRLIVCLVFFSLLLACKSDTVKTAPAKPRVNIPAFDKEGAFSYVEKQCAFGPRVPGTDAHKQCKDWMMAEFAALGAKVHSQDFTGNLYTGDKMPGSNIIAQFNPEKQRRIFLSAHWDSRRVGENDKDPAMQGKAIDGADDGASGVGVIMQIAKTIQANPIDLGVDIVLFDVEDQGERESQDRESWCLGSQYWAKNLYPENYKPEYGILLDMVGAKNPRFAKDQVSRRYAPKVQEKIWNLAKIMGYSDKFVNELGGNLTDDHYFVNVIAGIPMVDIINQVKDSPHGFGPHWHTHDDNIDVIDKNSLRVVGQVVLATLYKESDNSIQ